MCQQLRKVLMFGLCPARDMAVKLASGMAGKLHYDGKLAVPALC